jgi:hypothetical protein
MAEKRKRNASPEEFWNGFEEYINAHPAFRHLLHQIEALQVASQTLIDTLAADGDDVREWECSCVEPDFESTGDNPCPRCRLVAAGLIDEAKTP